MPKPPKKKDTIDLRPDAWERFERGLKKIGKVKPKHKTAKKSKR